mmetsp:Transcript_53945/g.115858  ORF Transcript_53945/g.115858 Transcript_53945/m.115858 type:complete len:415 (-) Transcript_53945:137-1381(-)
MKQGARDFPQSRQMKEDGEEATEEDLEPSSPDDAKPFIENSGAAARQNSSSSGSDEERPVSRLRGHGFSIGMVAAVGSLVAIAVCTAAGMASSKSAPATADGAAVASPQASPQALATMSARQLFVSDAHIEVATDNVMAMAKDGLDPEDRPLVRDHVANRFEAIDKDLAVQHPDASRALETVQLNSVQQAAVLRSMKAMGDPRMQNLGREIGEAMLSVGHSNDKEAAKRNLAELLTNRLDVVRQLHEEVCPPEVHLCDDDDGSEGVNVRVEKESMRMTKTLDSNWNFEFDVSKPEVSTDAVSLPARRLKKGGKGGGGLSLVDGLNFASHFAGFFKKIKKFAKTMGITVPDIGDALSQVNISKLLSCVATNAVKAKGASMFKCGQEFAKAAENVVQTLMGKQTKKGSSRGGKGGR